MLAPIHHRAAPIMAIASDGDLSCRPVAADAADEPAQMAAHFLVGRRFAWPQNDCDGASGSGVVNMDRKEAALIIMRIEQRQLMMTVRDIVGIIDIERDGLRRRGVTGAIEIDEDAAQLHDFAQGRPRWPGLCDTRLDVSGIGQGFYRTCARLYRPSARPLSRSRRPARPEFVCAVPRIFFASWRAEKMGARGGQIAPGMVVRRRADELPLPTRSGHSKCHVAMAGLGHGEKNSQRAYLVSIASISGIPKCSRAGPRRAMSGNPMGCGTVK